jgi:dihydrofolate reductase
MRKIVYYVAASIDGFISGPDDDISGFIQSGNGVERYLNDLKDFDTVLMGRKTYEFGYKYGLKPGQPAYPHMMHYIISNSLHFEHAHEKVTVVKSRKLKAESLKPGFLNLSTPTPALSFPLLGLNSLDLVTELKNQTGTDIYFCGGGEMAAWLVDNAMLDVLKIKLNPFIQGNGTRLFGPCTKRISLQLTKQEKFDLGLQMLTYDIKY